MAESAPAVESAQSRGGRRRERTRAALVKAAQQLIAEHRTAVAVLEITQLADVGMGSFYNHFESKEQLFEAAVVDALEAHGALMDELTRDLDDPAQVFAQSFRMTGRLHRLSPELSKVLLARGPSLITSDHGLAPRALRDLRRGNETGRFTIADPELALVIAGGAILALGHLLHSEPGRDEGEATDLVVRDLIRMFGLSAEEAGDVCSRALPDIDALRAAITDH